MSYKTKSMYRNLQSLSYDPDEISRTFISSTISSISSIEKLGQYRSRLAMSTFSFISAGRARDVAKDANASTCAFSRRGTWLMKKPSNLSANLIVASW